MTIQDQAYLFRHGIYERRFAKAFRGVLRANIYELANKLENGEPIDSADAKGMIRVYERLYLDIMRKEGKFIWNELVEPENGIRMKDVFDSLAADLPPEQVAEMPAFWTRLMKGFLTTYIAQRVTEVMNTTVKRFREAVERGRNEGLTDKEIARMQRADSRARELRANTIARTEGTTAMNKAWILSLQSSKMQWEKSWHAIRDERTRQDHWNTDPSIWIPITDNFIIGGYPMAFPGDSTQSAPAKEIIGCRCYLKFRYAGQRFGFRPKR